MKKSKWSATPFCALSLLLLIGALSNDSSAAPGDVDLSFDPGSGVNGSVTALAVQPDGKVIIGGSFTTVKGLTRRGIARLNADGSGDSTFDPGTGIDTGDGPTALVTALALQPDGKVLIAGYFDTVNGMNRNQIARLNPNGSVDTNFITSIDFVNPYDGSDYGAMNSITIQADVKVLVGGAFSTNDFTYAGIVRFNSDGSLDNAFDPAPEVEVASSVALQADGRMVIGGFMTIDFQNRQIARLPPDGSLDNTFNPGAGVTGGHVTS